MSEEIKKIKADIERIFSMLCELCVHFVDLTEDDHGKGCECSKICIRDMLWELSKE